MKNNSDLSNIIIRSIISILIFVMIIYLAKKYIAPEFEAAGIWFFQQFGLFGLFFITYLVDTFIVPASPDVFLALLIADGRHQYIGLALICIASILGGMSGYWIGHQIKNWRFLQFFTEKYQEKGMALFQKYGIGAVILGALTPVPFSVTCWLAGLFKMNYLKFVTATFFRIPRLILYYYLITIVWKNV